MKFFTAVWVAIGTVKADSNLVVRDQLKLCSTDILSLCTEVQTEVLVWGLGSGQDLMADSVEHGNENSRYTKGWGIFLVASLEGLYFMEFFLRR